MVSPVPESPIRKLAPGVVLTLDAAQEMLPNVTILPVVGQGRILATISLILRSDYGVRLLRKVVATPKQFLIGINREYLYADGEIGCITLGSRASSHVVVGKEGLSKAAILPPALNDAVFAVHELCHAIDFGNRGEDGVEEGPADEHFHHMNEHRAISGKSLVHGCDPDPENDFSENGYRAALGLPVRVNHLYTHKPADLFLRSCPDRDSFSHALIAYAQDRVWYDFTLTLFAIQHRSDGGEILADALSKAMEVDEEFFDLFNSLETTLYHILRREEMDHLGEPGVFSSAFKSFRAPQLKTWEVTSLAGLAIEDKRWRIAKKLLARKAYYPTFADIERLLVCFDETTPREIKVEFLEFALVVLRAPEDRQALHAWIEDRNLQGDQSWLQVYSSIFNMKS